MTKTEKTLIRALAPRLAARYGKPAYSITRWLIRKLRRTLRHTGVSGVYTLHAIKMRLDSLDRYDLGNLG